MMVVDDVGAAGTRGDDDNDCTHWPYGNYRLCGHNIQRRYGHQCRPHLRIHWLCLHHSDSSWPSGCHMLPYSQPGHHREWVNPTHIDHDRHHRIVNVSLLLLTDTKVVC